MCVCEEGDNVIKCILVPQFIYISVFDIMQAYNTRLSVCIMHACMHECAINHGLIDNNFSRDPISLIQNSMEHLIEF